MRLQVGAVLLGPPASNSHAVYSQAPSSNACGPKLLSGPRCQIPCAGERRVDLPVGVGCDAEQALEARLALLAGAR